MINVELVESDKFIDMSPKAQLLYFHLCMNADDDGFINKLKSLLRNYNLKSDVVKELESEGFIIKFSSSDCVITHWKQSNYLQKAKYRPTTNEYKDYVKLVNNVYVLKDENEEE